MRESEYRANEDLAQTLTYTSHGARVLQQYSAQHPERVVWNKLTGWLDTIEQIQR